MNHPQSAVLFAVLIAFGCRAYAAGNVPEGLWILDESQSTKLEPSAQTLWIVKDDGVHLVWVSVETFADGRNRVTSWNGTYGGPAATVSGTGFVSRATSDAPGTMRNSGEIPGAGSYREECQVEPSRTRMSCKGQVETADGVRTWSEIFRWVGPSPSSSIATNSR